MEMGNAAGAFKIRSRCQLLFDTTDTIFSKYGRVLGRSIKCQILCFLIFSSTGYLAMCQPITPNPDNPKTVDDYNALKALEAAKADALDAQARLIASQKALDKAKAADDPATQQLADATQTAAIAAQ